MAYKRSRIYYWSGTGNSFRVASWLDDAANDAGVKSQIGSIDVPVGAGDVAGGKDTLLALAYPSHGFTAPWHVFKFVVSLPRGHAADAVILATRAALKFGRVFVPGISGSGTFLLALILLLKGYRVRGLNGIDMPSNWFSLHPIQSRASHEAIIMRAKRKTIILIQNVLGGRRAGFYPYMILEFVFAILLSWLSVGYLFVGRFFLAKLFFANKDCNACGLCVDYCSVGAIRMMGKKNPKPFWRYNCESCMRCAAFCPHNAIEAGHSWAVILYFLTAIPVSAYLFSIFGDTIPRLASFQGHWTEDLIQLLYFYPACFISYAVFQLLVRIPAINWLFSNTTFTHLKNWGRYKEPDVRLKTFAEKRSRVVE